MKSVKILLVILIIIAVIGIALIIGRCVTGSWNPMDWISNDEQYQKELNFDLLIDSEDKGVKLMTARIPRNAYNANNLSDNVLIATYVTAKLYPDSVENCSVDWNLYSEQVGYDHSYLDYEISESDPLTIVLKCYQAFPDITFTLTCTSNDSGVYGSLTIRCEGIPTELSVNGVDENNAISLKWYDDYDLAISLSNDLGFVGENYINNIVIESFNVHGTIDCWGDYFVSEIGSKELLCKSPSYAFSNTHLDFNEVYNVDDYFEYMIEVYDGQAYLRLAVDEYPMGTAESINTGYVKNGVVGTMFHNATLPPKDAYIDITLRCGNLKKTIKVNLVVGVESVSLGPDIVY